MSQVDPLRCFNRRRILLAALAGLCLPGTLRAGTATIALTNGAVPEGNGSFDFLSTPALSSSGQITFFAGLKNTGGGSVDDSGIYLHNGATLLNRARENGAAPEGNGSFDAFNLPTINSLGQVAFRADLKGTSGGANDNSGIYLHNAATLINRARENAGAPEGNGAFTTFGDPVVNGSGQLAFRADLKSTGGGTNDDSGVYFHDNTNLFLRVRENTAVPEGNGTFSSFSNIGMRLTDAGQVAIFATLKNTSGGINDDSGIYYSDTGSLVNRVHENAGVPEGNGSFNFIGLAAMNRSGQIAFQSTLRSTGGGTNDDSGVYFHNGASLLNRARENAGIPDGTGSFNSFSDVVLNGLGQVGFVASLKNTTLGNVDNEGVYLHNGSYLQNIVRKNDAVPDGNGAFDNFTTLAINSSGQMVFHSLLKTTSGASTDNLGIYLANSFQTLKVVRKGDILAGKTVNTMNMSTGGGESGTPSPLNDFGQVAYSVQFNDGSYGVFLFTPELHWRSNFSASWDDSSSWTLGLHPGMVHDVMIDPTASVTVYGPTSATTVKSLQIGSFTGVATLQLQQGATLTSLLPVEVKTSGVLTGDGIVFSAGGLNNAGVIVADNLTITGGTFTNTGTIRGDGRIGGSAPLVNAVSGRIRATAGDLLRLTSTSNSNFGLIEVIGNSNVLGGNADLFFANAVTNAASTGLIVARGDANLRFNGGLSNSGAVAIAFAQANMYGDITNNSGGQITISASNVLFLDDVVNNGSISVATGSTAVFLGSFSGANGTTGGGNVQLLGDLRPGNSPASVGFGGDVVLGPGASTNIELGGPTPGTQHDRINIAGHADLDGTMNVTAIDGFVPLPGDEFDVMTYASRSGTFDLVNGTGYAGLTFVADYAASALTLTAHALFDGDANLDGMVDIADLYILATHFKTSGDWLAADFTGDGLINSGDLGILATNWQAGVGAPLAPSLHAALASLGLPAVSVPEPVLAPLGLATALLVRRRRVQR